MEWPSDFVPAAGREAILTTWDAWVDDLWSGVTGAGMTLLSASFPRAYIDANRDVRDIDADLLDGPWPEVLEPSDYTRRGMGLIRRFALPGVPMYADRLSPDAVAHRIRGFYRPYRDKLAGLVTSLHTRFGQCCHLNVHSMKSRGNAMNTDGGRPRPQIVVSDRRGSTADPALTGWIAGWFRDRGLAVGINEPYQGGDIVASTGRPAAGVHSVQIEFSRSLYMDEEKCERSSGFDALHALCTSFARDLAGHFGGRAGGGAMRT